MNMQLFFSGLKTGKPVTALAVFFLFGLNSIAQDSRIQYPGSLKNSYYSVNIGYINYPFSSGQLEPGYTVGSVKVPHTAVRLVLYGREINKNLSARITYMRPVNWVIYKYKDINGENSQGSVWMNVAGLTLAARLPLQKKISLFAEAGLGIVTRSGFKKNNVPVVPSTAFATVLTGAALQYHINNKWDLQLSTAWTPAHAGTKQPHSIFYAAGFNYYMRELPPEVVESKRTSGYHFPKQVISASVTSNVLGYGVNNAVSGKVPIFWGGDVHIRQGFSLNYQRNVFHTRKVFALDVGACLSWWQSRDNRQHFFTASLYPVMLFNAIRTKSFDIFFEYSVAGPTYISKTVIDGFDTGRNFTFYDFMGMGMVTGKKRNLVAGLRISHFSNGNIYWENAGLKIPLTLNLGYVPDW
jgi:hypothetical protein